MISLDVPINLPSVRSDKRFNKYRLAKVRNIQIARCAEQFLIEMNVHGLSRIAEAFKPWGRVKIHADVYRKRTLDDDNLLMSVNKLLIDPMVRKGYLSSDAKSKVRLTAECFVSDDPHVTLTFSKAEEV
jgi:hypothetical protein